MLSRQILTTTTTCLVTVVWCFSSNDAYRKQANYRDYDLSEQYLEEVFENITDPGHYNRHVRPPSAGPTVVSTSLNILSIDGISSQYLQLGVILLVSHTWSDLRLSYHNQTRDVIDISLLCIDGMKWHLDRVWSPSLYLLNEHQGRLMDITEDNLYISVCPEGHLYYQYRIQETLHCSMDLLRFPFDTQMCKIELGSWRYSNSSVVLEWDSGYTPISGNVIVVNEFKLNRYQFRKELRQDLGRGSSFSDSRSYSVLVVELYLDRQWGYYFIQYYVTSFMLVFISWISLWLDKAAAPARVTLGTSTLLTFVTLAGNSKAVLPKVSAITLIDWWYFLCMLFIVATLLEYALVNITYRRQSVVHMKKPAAKYIMKSALSSEAPTPRRLSVASFSQAAFTNPNYDYSEMNQISIMSLPDFERYRRHSLTVDIGSKDISDLNDLKNQQFLQVNTQPKDSIEVALNNSQKEVNLNEVKQYLQVNKLPKNNIEVALNNSQKEVNLNEVKQYLQVNKLPKNNIEVALNNSQKEVNLNEVKDVTDQNISLNDEVEDEQQNHAEKKEKDTISSHSIPELKVIVPTLGRFEKPFYEMTYPEIAEWIDTRSRIVFPILFLLVNIIYWIAILIPNTI